MWTNKYEAGMTSEFIEVFTEQLRQAMLKAAPDLAGASTPELDGLEAQIAKLTLEIADHRSTLAKLEADLSRLDAPVAVGAGGKDFMKSTVYGTSNVEPMTST
jgi:septal ring factor EnvC (AmiA/AmiB activator)